MTTEHATDSTCSAQRAIHEGRRAGHCSKRPNASNADSPMNISRPITRGVDSAVNAGLRSRPTTPDATKTTSTRRQLNVRARPRGGGVRAEVAMV